MDKDVYTHTHIHTCIHQYYSIINNEEILTFATAFMELEGLMLREISQTKEDKCCMISFIGEI